MYKVLIYKIVNKINGKIYIGQTSNPLKYRWNRHLKENNTCTALKNAIKKYGRENFTISIICRCNSLEEANHREEYCIRIYKTLAPNGYNLLKGGNNRDMAQIVKGKISKTLTGRKMYFKDPIQRGLNISKAKKGRAISIKTIQAMQTPVRCVETGELFESLASVTRKYGGHTTNLSKHLNGIVRIFKGLTFKRV